MNNIAPESSLKQRFVDAMQLHVQGQLEAARAAYEALLQEWPGQPDILHGLGTIAMQTQQLDKATGYFEQALMSQPGQLRYLMPLARVYVQLGRNDRAMETLVKALDIDPNLEEARTMLYELCLPEVEAHGVKGSTINRLIAANPNVLGLRSVALMLCRITDTYIERIEHLEALHRNGVNEELFYQEYAITLKDNGYFERCLALCQEGLRRYPESSGLYKLRAHMYLTVGQPEKALEDWQWVVAHEPENHQARAAIGLIKLLMSDGREGYEEYASHRDLALAEFKLRGSLPEWRGETLSGKHILIWCSQGMGDVIMYAGLLPWVLAQGARVTLSLYPKMIPLFARSFPSIRTVLFTNDIFTRYAGECDFQLLSDQLMRYALPHYVPAEHPPYLKADAPYAEALSAKYRALFPGKKLVGISWLTKNPHTFSQRNIPLIDWQPIFTLPNVQIVSLQYGDCAAEIEDINRRFPGAIYVDPDIDPFNDPDALTAQIMALDEVVSVQNTTIHMGGALGVKTTLLLSAASEWRWGMKRTDSRWYKSVTIERQPKIGEWQPVLSRLRDRLAQEA